MSTVTIRTAYAVRSRFTALPLEAAQPRLPAKPRLAPPDPSLWWIHALRRSVWRWSRRSTRRGTATVIWC